MVYLGSMIVEWEVKVILRALAVRVIRPHRARVTCGSQWTKGRRTGLTSGSQAGQHLCMPPVSQRRLVSAARMFWCRHRVIHHGTTITQEDTHAHDPEVSRVPEVFGVDHAPHGAHRRLGTDGEQPKRRRQPAPAHATELDAGVDRPSAANGLCGAIDGHTTAHQQRHRPRQGGEDFQRADDPNHSRLEDVQRPDLPDGAGRVSRSGAH
jgi:hypothetical protein